MMARSLARPPILSQSVPQRAAQELGSCRDPLADGSVLVPPRSKMADVDEVALAGSVRSWRRRRP
jgi:hypothetical protein